MKLLTLAMLLCATRVLLADGRDTLRSYDQHGRFIYYRDTSIVAQAARFDLPAPGTVRGLRLLVGGKGTGAFTVHIYGSEGRSAPSIEHDLARPIPGRKMRPGVEWVIVDLPEPLFIDDPQFFVVVDRLGDDMRLLSDKKVRHNECVSGSDHYFSQAVKRADGNWQWGKYGYVIDVDIESGHGAHRPNFVDVTDYARLPDSVADNRSIAWADFDGDGYLDVVVGGRLYRNNGDGTFADITRQSGITGTAAANIAVDMNNDGHVDILFVGADSTSARLFINQGNDKFLSHAIDLPGIAAPTSFSLADVSNDGYIDLFIGQDGVGDSLGGHLFINDRKLGFLRDDGPNRYGKSRGSQFVDMDGDGDLDLYLAEERYPYGAIWRNTGSGGLEWNGPVAAGESSTRDAVPAGCSWADYDNDGRPDLLYPAKEPVMAKMASLAESATMLLGNRGEGRYAPDERTNHVFGYEPRREGGAWGDANNDGLLDFISTTSCECASADLYEQVPDQGFQRKTYENGLFGVPAGVDAVWVDYDNDGRLDLSFFVHGRFRLFHNQARLPDANSASFDLSHLAEPGKLAGAHVTVYAGQNRYTKEITMGRGLLMQDPARLHFGVGGARGVDSVQVQFPGAGGSAMTFTHVDMNAVNYLMSTDAGTGSTGALALLDARPNPFTSELRITYDLPKSGHVVLRIFSVTGETIATLVDANEQAGSHTVAWKATDGNGSMLPQGDYIYRLTTDAGDVDGRAVLAR
jgi:hypothetical protein